MSKHTRENLIFDARKRFEVFDRRGRKDAAEFAMNFLCNKITKEKGFYSENTTLVMNSIKDGFLATHLDMWEQLGELVCTKCSTVLVSCQKNCTTSLSVSSMSFVDKIFETQKGANYKFLGSSSASTTKC